MGNVDAIRKTKTDDQCILKYAELLSTCFPQSNRFHVEYLSWLYRDNPWGPVIGFDAFDGEQLVAHYVTIPIVAELRGKTHKGCLSLNTATHPNYQGQGLFSKLAEATYAEAHALGKEFILGVANGNSTHGFVHRLGFTLISSLDVFFVLGPFHVSSNHESFQVKWDRSAQEWRTRSPLSTYSFTKEGMTLKRYGGLLDVFLSSRFNQGHAEKSAAAPVKLWIGLNKGMASHRWRRLNFPTFLKPSPLNLIFKDLSGSIQLQGPDDVFFEAIDFDAF